MRNELEPKLREGRRDEKGLERGNRSEEAREGRKGKIEEGRTTERWERKGGEKKNEEERRREREEERKKCLTRAMHNGERRNPLAGVP